MLRKAKRKINGHLIPHSSYLLIFGRLLPNLVAHLRIDGMQMRYYAARSHTLTSNVSGHFHATGVPV